MDLFGRKKLKQRIEELEDELATCQEEKEELQRQRDKYDKRFKEAETAKQEAQRKLKKAETKIETLQDRIGSEKDTETSRTTETHMIAGISDILQTLSSISFNDPVARTRAVNDDGTGAITLADPSLIGIRIHCPLPIDPLDQRQDHFVTGPLEDQIDGRFLIVHLSAGGSGAALIDGREIEDAVTVKADIKSSHKKGGYSQKRFENIRNQQIDEHIETVLSKTETIREHGAEHIIVTGAARMRDRFLEAADLGTVHELGTPVSRVEDDDDLIDAFKKAMQYEIEKLSPEEIATFLDNV